METISSRNGFMYYGEREGWLVAYGQHASNDDTVAESNFRTMAHALGIDNVGDPYGGPNGQNADDTAAVESYGGAFGRGQYLLVKPGSRAESEALEMLDRIADYPLLDEDDHSELEYANAHTVTAGEIHYRYRHTEWADDDATNWIASAYLSLHDHGTDAHTDWDDTRWGKMSQQDRNTLAAAIRDWRKHRHAA